MIRDLPRTVEHPMRFCAVRKHRHRPCSILVQRLSVGGWLRFRATRRQQSLPAQDRKTLCTNALSRIGIPVLGMTAACAAIGAQRQDDRFCRTCATQPARLRRVTWRYFHELASSALSLVGKLRTDLPQRLCQHRAVQTTLPGATTGRQVLELQVL